jgi:phage-related protein
MKNVCLAMNAREGPSWSKSKIIDTLSNVKVLYKKVLNSLARMMYVNLLQSFCYYIFATQKHPEKTTDLQQVTDKL